MAFTRNWDETVPNDNNYAYDIDDFIRYLRTDCSDRLKDLVYGFTAGENDGVQGIKTLPFKQQSSAPSTPAADIITLYSIDDGSNCGLYAIQEDGYVKQILKKSGTSLILNIANGDLASVTSLTGLTTLTAGGNLDIGAYELRAQTLQSDVATGTAPLTVASTTKVANFNADMVDGFSVTAAANQESNPIVGGLVIKAGTNHALGAVTFGAAFPSACIAVVVSYYGQVQGVDLDGCGASSLTAAGFTAYGESGKTVNWIAVGV